MRVIAKMWAKILAVASLLWNDERGELILNLADPQELVGFVREIQRDVDESELLLSNFLPNVFQDDIAFKYTVGQVLSKNAAKFRNWDTPAPIGERQGAEQAFGELAPISEKLPMGEELSHRMRALEGGDNGRLIDAIFADAENLARAIARRFELARGEVLETGGLTLNENGVVQTIDFGRDAALEPAALAGTAMWSDLDDSDPIANLQTWSDVFASFNNGRRPQVALSSSAVTANLMRNASIRTLAASALGTPQIVSAEALAATLRAFRLPQFVEYDTTILVDGVATEVISDDVVILLGGPDARPGRTVFGPTLEAIELAEAQAISVEDAPGLVAVVDKPFDPPGHWTKVAGVGLPLLTDPNASLVVEVQ